VTYCGDLERYDPRESSTYVALKEEWTEQVEDFYPMYGIWVQDRFAISGSRKTNSTIFIDNFKFVSGLRMDSR
jgi:hypothetical protein